MGVATGFLGASLFRRLQDGDFEKDVEKIRGRLSDSVKDLEDRISGAVDVVSGAVEGPSNA